MHFYGRIPTILAGTHHLAMHYPSSHAVNNVYEDIRDDPFASKLLSPGILAMVVLLKLVGVGGDKDCGS